MKRKISRFLVLCIMMSVLVACNHRRTNQTEDAADTIEIADSLNNDSAFFFDDEDDGLTMHEEEIEVFGDFIYAFTHNTRFQAERVKFPLPITELDGTERTITSGKQFRSEFILPNNDYYVVMLGERSQIDLLESDTILETITMQVMNLEELNMKCYQFTRSDKRWYLTLSNHSPIPSPLDGFMRFYGEFTTDSVFQQESVAERILVTIADEDESEEEEEVEGTIERGQWPIFRPDMPGLNFVNIDFGQSYPHPDHLIMLQCGISNSMMNTFTFRREYDRWKLVSYEN